MFMYMYFTLHCSLYMYVMLSVTEYQSHQAAHSPQPTCDMLAMNPSVRPAQPAPVQFSQAGAQLIPRDD